MMRILLVLAETLSALDNFVCAPLGLLNIAAIAEKRGHEVKILNLRVFRSLRETKKELDKSINWSPEIVGLSAVSPSGNTFAAIAKVIRNRLPNALLIGGGPHGTVDSEELLRNGHVDLCVQGEGERTFELLLEQLENRADFSSVTGISFTRDNTIVENSPTPYIEDLDNLPLPSWHLIDFHRYRRYCGMTDFFRWGATIFTSRGCPYHCIYCHNIFGKTFRARSPENVLSEIDLLRNRFGVRWFEIVDDIFNFDRERAVAILHGIIHRFPDIHISFPNGLRIDILDEEVIHLLGRAGCWHVSVAIETTSKRLQKEIRKNLNIDTLHDNISLLRNEGIIARGFLMIGFPGETRQEILGTMETVIAMPLNYSLIFFVSPFNQTELANRLRQHHDADRISLTSQYEFRAGASSFSAVPYDELVEIRNAYFYRGILRIRNWKLWVSTLKGLFSAGSLKKFILLFPILLGLKRKRFQQFGLQLRDREFQQFKKTIEEA